MVSKKIKAQLPSILCASLHSSFMFARSTDEMRSARHAGPALQGAGVAGEPGDVGAWLGLDPLVLLHLPRDGAAGGLEDGAVHEEVVLRVPHPVLPHALVGVVLGDLPIKNRSSDGLSAFGLFSLTGH